MSKLEHLVRVLQRSIRTHENFLSCKNPGPRVAEKVREQIEMERELISDILNGMLYSSCSKRGERC
jgi:hypothetical protein